MHSTGIIFVLDFLRPFCIILLRKVMYILAKRQTLLRTKIEHRDSCQKTMNSNRSKQLKELCSSQQAFLPSLLPSGWIADSLLKVCV